MLDAVVVVAWADADELVGLTVDYTEQDFGFVLKKKDSETDFERRHQLEMFSEEK